MKQYDVVTLGETMIRLTPPNLDRIEQTNMFEIHIGGTESNMATGLARLGLDVLWISRLTNNPLGKRLTSELERHGVDTSEVVWTDDDRVGVFWVEEARAPRRSQVIYDRKGSAFSQMQPSDLPRQLFTPDRSKLLHLTGITLAVSDSAAKTAHAALQLAQSAGWKTSFDLNFRSKLWTPEAARASYEFFLNSVDIVFAPLSDLETVFGIDRSTPTEQILEKLGNDYPHTTFVVTMGKNGAIARHHDGAIVYQPVFEAEEVGRIGGGDAFDAGFLYTYCQSSDEPDWLEQALLWGNACAAMKYTIRGDIPVFDFDEVKQLVEGNHGRGVHR